MRHSVTLRVVLAPLLLTHLVDAHRVITSEVDAHGEVEAASDLKCGVTKCMMNGTDDSQCCSPVESQPGCRADYMYSKRGSCGPAAFTTCCSWPSGEALRASGLGFVQVERYWTESAHQWHNSPTKVRDDRDDRSTYAALRLDGQEYAFIRSYLVKEPERDNAKHFKLRVVGGDTVWCRTGYLGVEPRAKLDRRDDASSYLYSHDIRSAASVFREDHDDQTVFFRLQVVSGKHAGHYLHVAGSHDPVTGHVKTDSRDGSSSYLFVHPEKQDAIDFRWLTRERSVRLVDYDRFMRSVDRSLPIPVMPDLVPAVDENFELTIDVLIPGKEHSWRSLGIHTSKVVHTWRLTSIDGRPINPPIELGNLYIHRVGQQFHFIAPRKDEPGGYSTGKRLHKDKEMQRLEKKFDHFKELDNNYEYAFSIKEPYRAEKLLFKDYGIRFYMQDPTDKSYLTYVRVDERHWDVFSGKHRCPKECGFHLYRAEINLEWVHVYQWVSQDLYAKQRKDSLEVGSAVTASNEDHSQIRVTAKAGADGGMLMGLLTVMHYYRSNYDKLTFQSIVCPDKVKGAVGRGKPEGGSTEYCKCPRGQTLRGDSWWKHCPKNDGVRKFDPSLYENCECRNCEDADNCGRSPKTAALNQAVVCTSNVKGSIAREKGESRDLCKCPRGQSVRGDGDHCPKTSGVRKFDPVMYTNCECRECEDMKECK